MEPRDRITEPRDGIILGTFGVEGTTFQSHHGNHTIECLEKLGEMNNSFRSLQFPFDQDRDGIKRTSP